MELSKYTQGLLDFHNHTTYSDGGDSPLELVQRAKKAGVSAMALTDHNVIGGLEEFTRACEERDIFAMPFGTEIYAELPPEVLTPVDNEAPDLVMLGKNPKIDLFKDYQDILGRHWREFSYPEHLRKIKQHFKLPDGFDEKAMPKELDEFRIPWIIHHFVEYGDNPQRLGKLLQEREAELNGKKVMAEDVNKDNAIKLLNRFFYSIGGPGYVRRLTGGFTVEKAVAMADAMDCKLFIAHPGGEFGFLSDKILEYYIQNGIHGIEVRNYFNTPAQNEQFDRLAREHGLIRSGGSDCHGKNSRSNIGMYDKPQNQLPKYILEKLWDNLP